MKKAFLVVSIVCSCLYTKAQVSYFPPVNSAAWDTISPASLGWCEPPIDTLYDYLAQQSTRAFIVLVDGKIVLEKYFGSFTADSAWYWASAGKSLTGFMVGLAQEDGFLNIKDTSSKYLGKAWTSCPPMKEHMISIRHQLTMTTGLDDGVADPDCTTPGCLQYLADAGTRWAYHNAPYTLLDVVLANATGMTLNKYVTTRLRNKTGITGLYLQTGSNNVFYSTARSMARFGLLVLNGGKWGSAPIMHDTAYFRQMLNSSTTLNPSYGYLWWLNGKASFRLPQTQVSFPGSISPHAPADMVAAIGKNGQLLNIVPSQKLVFVRMGDAATNVLVPASFNDSIWVYLNKIMCTATNVANAKTQPEIKVFPNPFRNRVTISGALPGTVYTLANTYGQVIYQGANIDTQNFAVLPQGVYILNAAYEGENRKYKLIKAD